MGKFVDRTGEIFRELQIVEELRGYKVLCKCTKCGHQDNYDKGQVTKMQAICKNCGTTRKDIIGQLYGDLLTSEYVDKKWVKCTCIKCGHIDNYLRAGVFNNTALCKNCGDRGRRIKDRVGQLYGVLTVTEELKGGKVECKCTKCGHIDIYVKPRVVEGKAPCKQCRAGSNAFINRIGQIYRDLQIIEELGKGMVNCNCLKCGNINEYVKNKVVRSNALCKNCGTVKKERLRETFNDLQIVEELGGNKVMCKCTLCKHIDKYDKTNVLRAAVICKKCKLNRNYKGKIINNVKVIEFAYKGRNEQLYYNCKCNKCGEELILTREEIVRYTCTKEQNNG